jgi:hypothetical protein
MHRRNDCSIGLVLGNGKGLGMDSERANGRGGTVARTVGCVGSTASVALGLVLGALAGTLIGLLVGIGIAAMIGLI